MSRRAYPVGGYSLNTKPESVQPVKTTKKRKRTAGDPQGLTRWTQEKTTIPKPENAIPTNRWIFQEAIETQAGNKQSPAAKTSVQLVDKTERGQWQNNTMQQKHKTKQTEFRWEPKGLTEFPEADEDYERDEESIRQREEKEKREREMREKIEEAERHREELEKAKEEYEGKQRRREERRERWDGFSDQFQGILKTGGSAIAGEWNGLWNYMTGKDWKQFWEEPVREVHENISETVNFLKDPFAALGNFIEGKAVPSDGEYLQKWGQRGETLRDILTDPMPYIANYLTGEAAVTDNENLKLAAEYGRKNNLLNYGRYYSDTLVGGVLDAIGVAFGTKEGGALENARKELIEEGRENYDRIINSFPPILRDKVENSIISTDLLTDCLLALGGGMPAALSLCAREYGKARDEAKRKGHSSAAQTSYAIEEAIQRYFRSLENGYDLSENDRGFLEKFGEYVSRQKEIIDVFENADERSVLDLIESLLLFVKPGADRVLNGTEEPDARDIPEIYDNMIASLLDQAEEKVNAWEKKAWEPREDIPDRIWGLPEYDNGSDMEASEKAGKTGESWYNKAQEEIDLPPGGSLPPNMTYRAGEFGYTYQTDSQGRISEWHAGELELTERTGRLPYVRNTPGKQLGDHAGHLAGDRFGGSGKLDNLVSQYWLVNLSSYKRLENEWSRAIQAGKTVDVNVQIVYQGDDLRPSEFIIEYTIDGERETKRITNDFLGGMS